MVFVLMARRPGLAGSRPEAGGTVRGGGGGGRPDFRKKFRWPPRRIRRDWLRRRDRGLSRYRREVWRTVGRIPRRGFWTIACNGCFGRERIRRRPAGERHR